DGSIMRWNDPKITATNAGVTLPDQPIVVCARADSSGTSFNFSTYLAKVSPEFKMEVAPSKTPNWGASSLHKAPGNPGVAGCVKSNDNSVGYIDQGDAQRAGLLSKSAAIKSAAGSFVSPSTQTVSAAGKLAPAAIPKDLTADLTNSSAPGAY